MGFQPSSFTKGGDFDVQEGKYLIVDANAVIPAMVSKDPEKQAIIDAQPPVTVVRLHLTELDDDVQVIDPGVVKQLDLKGGVPANVRPHSEPTDDITDASDEKGTEGRYLVPNSFKINSGSKLGHFLEHLVNSGVPEDYFNPEVYDVHQLIGFKLAIRPKEQAGVVDRKTGAKGNVWFHYEPYAILEMPDANAGKTKKAGAKAQAGTQAKAVAKAAPAKAQAKAVAPPPEPEEESADSGDTEESATEILSQVIGQLSKGGKEVSLKTVRFNALAKISKLDADMQAQVKQLIMKNDEFVNNAIEALV